MSFTIGMISDAHLGYSSGRKRINETGYNARENDGYIAYNKAIDEMIEHKVDYVIIPGDIFHSPRPKNHTILIAQEGLRRLANADIPVYIIAGNHDATDIRMEVPSSRLLHEPNSKIYSYSEPYVVKEIHEGVYAHFVSHHAYTEQDETMSEISLVEDAVNILVTHGSTYDTNMQMILRSPGEPREVIIPQHIMDLPWDYTFMGHIHERGWVGSTDGLTDTGGRKQFYGGSLVRRGFADKECNLNRGWTKWTVDGNVITPEFFNIMERPQFDMAAIHAEGKTHQEIEVEIVEQLKAILEYMKKNFGTINIYNTPIVRQTIVGISSKTHLLINWKRITALTDKFLTYTAKVEKIGAVINNEGKITAEALQSNDIVIVFKEWNKDVELDIDEDIKADVVSYAEKFLKASRDKELENE